MPVTSTRLKADRISRLGTENAFKIGVDIRRCEAAGMKVVKLNLGEPDFNSAAPINEIAKREIDRGNSHYCDPQGILPLRETVARQVSRTRRLNVEPDEVVVTPGAKPPIFYTMLTYVNAGDEVIYPSPGFPIYESCVTFCGGTPVPLHLEESRGFRFTATDIERLISPRTKVIILNSPSNPTGGVLTRQDLDDIAAVIRARCDDSVRVYSDEVYEHIVFDGLEHASIASVPGMRERTILVSGHSKSYAMTGWRLGYAVLPHKEEAQIFKNLNINIISCTPPFIQMAGKEALENPAIEPLVADMVRQFQTRRDWVVRALNEIPGVTCATPKGAFYVFPNIGGVCESLGLLDAYATLPPERRARTSPSTLFQLFALYRHGVATMDRNSFGRIGAEGRHFLRLSTATDLDSLKDGVRRLAEAAQDRKGFEDYFREVNTSCR
ncbi:MAG: aminotransferase class I/II-fold pyridoxal phosphate-dependent enzyme [Planctomycetes bacterium]|nr:aminotransferase class I/II-fold pyridoxal phosphate-dependent enzyme [Planctomycetota bacterium]